MSLTYCNAFGGLAHIFTANAAARSITRTLAFYQILLCMAVSNISPTRYVTIELKLKSVFVANEI